MSKEQSLQSKLDAAFQLLREVVSGPPAEVLVGRPQASVQTAWTRCDWFKRRLALTGEKVPSGIRV